MNINLALFYFLIASFLFFRYIRANRSVVTLLFSFLFLGLTVYEVRNNIVYVFLMVMLIALEILVSFLKEKKHSYILRIQKGYKPLESILHYVIFGIIVFALFVLKELLK
jgi:hypothetical protein